MTPNQNYIDAQAALFSLRKRTPDVLRRIIAHCHAVAHLATVPENRRDTEALATACWQELARRAHAES